MHDIISVKWKDKGKWMPFDLNDINHMPKNHAISLFSHAVPVIAKQGGTYIVNNTALFDQYTKQKKPVKMFSDLTPDDQALFITGLI